MAARHLLTLPSLALALALGACGGDAPEADETVVVDPAAPADPAAEPTAALPEDGAETLETETEETAEALATEVEEGTEAAAAELEEGAETVAAEVEEGAETMAAEIEEGTEAAVAEVGEGWEAMQGDWANSAGLVKDRWSDLTEEEILATEGDREQLVVLVQERYGIEREQAEQEVNDWASTL